MSTYKNNKKHSEKVKLEGGPSKARTTRSERTEKDTKKQKKADLKKFTTVEIPPKALKMMLQSAGLPTNLTGMTLKAKISISDNKK